LSLNFNPFVASKKTVLHFKTQVDQSGDYIVVTSVPTLILLESKTPFCVVGIIENNTTKSMMSSNGDRAA
jgi:hypothetical protein